jgi:hypothetical protein
MTVNEKHICKVTFINVISKVVIIKVFISIVTVSLNIRLGWKGLPGTILFCLFIGDEEKQFNNNDFRCQYYKNLFCL